MDVLPFISFLILLFALVLISEIIRLKKELRKLTRLARHMQKDIEKLKAVPNEK